MGPLTRPIGRPDRQPNNETVPHRRSRARRHQDRRRRAAVRRVAFVGEPGGERPGHAPSSILFDVGIISAELLTTISVSFPRCSIGPLTATRIIKKPQKRHSPLDDKYPATGCCRGRKDLISSRSCFFLSVFDIAYGGWQTQPDLFELKRAWRINFCSSQANTPLPRQSPLPPMDRKAHYVPCLCWREWVRYPPLSHASEIQTRPKLRFQFQSRLKRSLLFSL